MDEPEYFKCACKECGTHIEFPVAAAGTTVSCPNCKQWTELTVPGGRVKEVEAPGITINLGWVVAILALAIVVGLAFWWQHTKQAEPGKEVVAPIAKVVAPPTNLVVNIATNPIVVTSPAVALVEEKPKPKSPEDLKVGEIKLEKTPGNSLVNAVGTVTNDSTWQRFGVRVELELFNAEHKKIGTAQDYKEILEPHQAWQFRALIPEKKVVSAKLATVTEQ